MDEKSYSTDMLKVGRYWVGIPTVRSTKLKVAGSSSIGLAAQKPGSVMSPIKMRYIIDYRIIVGYLAFYVLSMEKASQVPCRRPADLEFFQAS